MAHEKLYSDLAWIWPIMSPPNEYVEEGEFFLQLIEKHARLSGNTTLNLGCGGGHLDFTLKRKLKITGVDQSEAMLSLARELNPDASYFQGDMRTVRLNGLFDIVLIHDAISYMLTEQDLSQVFETAYMHLKPGGMFLTVIEEIPEKFIQNKVTAFARARNGTEVTYIENYYDADTSDSTYDYVLIYLIRQNKQLRVEVDRHVCGIFPLKTWSRLLKKAGFEGQLEDHFKGSDAYNEGFIVLMAFKPSE